MNSSMPPAEVGTQSLPLKLAYPFLAANGLGAEANEIRNSTQRLAGIGGSTLRRARIAALLHERSLLDSFIQKTWPQGKTADGKKRLERYERIFKKFQNNETEIPEEVAQEGNNQVSSQFALEEHLRDYLAENCRY
jgi:hypothetical protein